MAYPGPPVPATETSVPDTAPARPLQVRRDAPLVPGPTAAAPEIPDLSQEPNRSRTYSHLGLTVGWLAVTLVALAAMLTGWADVGVPAWLEPWLPLGGAVLITTTYAFTLAVRVGATDPARIVPRNGRKAAVLIGDVDLMP